MERKDGYREAAEVHLNARRPYSLPLESGRLHGLIARQFSLLNLRGTRLVGIIEISRFDEDELILCLMLRYE